MEVILKQDVRGLGYKNDVVSVRGGYGRNYLIPNGLAVVANVANRHEAEENTRQTAHKLEYQKEAALELMDRLTSLQIEVRAKAGKQGRLFGTITTQHLSDALAEINIKIDKEDLKLLDNVKTLGTHEATATLHRDITHTFSYQVISEETE